VSDIIGPKRPILDEDDVFIPRCGLNRMGHVNTPILPGYRAISLRQYRKRIPTRGGPQVTFGEGILAARPLS
jgi:hypothetical protein